MHLQENLRERNEILCGSNKDYKNKDANYPNDVLLLLVILIKTSEELTMIYF